MPVRDILWAWAVSTPITIVGLRGGIRLLRGRRRLVLIAESTVPKGAPEPAMFVQAIGWLDKDGKSIRYRTVYQHEIHGLKEAPVPAR